MDIQQTWHGMGEAVNRNVTPKRGGHMKNRLKVKWLLGAVLGLGLFTGKAFAANPDAMQISVTPTVTYAVTIASVTVGSGYNFGTVGLGASTQSTAAIVLTNTGNVAEFFSIAISSSSGNWGPVQGAPSADTFRMGALLNTGGQPAFGSITSYLQGTPVPTTAGSLYGQGSTKTSPAGTKNLWLSLEMPSSLVSGGTGAQTMTLIVNGQAS